MQKNLQGFWAVQKCSGEEYHIFLSQEEAQNACDKWNAELDLKLQSWLSGDRTISDSLIMPNLEADLEGGCYQNYIINPAWRPSGYSFIPAYSATFAVWQKSVGCHRVSWGNPATARPAK
jgi:hypothetical protein